MQISVILPAAGVGSRFGVGGAHGTAAAASASKIEFLIDSKPVFLHAVDALRAVPEVGQILLAVHPDRKDDFSFRWQDLLRDRRVQLIAGGRVERWETVQLALAAVDAAATHIAVHDAARPLVPLELLQRLMTAARRHPAVIPALPVSSTLKRVNDEPLTSQGSGDSGSEKDAIDRFDEILDLTNAPPISPLIGNQGTGDARASARSVRSVVETVPRQGLIAVQTPQIFEAALLRRAYAAAAGSSAEAAWAMAGITDDASLVETPRRARGGGGGRSGQPETHPAR